MDSQSDTDTLDFTLRIGLNYMRYWENSHDIDTITGWVERYVNTLLKQLRHSFGGFENEGTVLYDTQEEQALQFKSSISAKKLLAELGSLRTSIWHYC